MRVAAFVGQALKAFYAALVSGLGALQVALVGGESLGQLTGGQWVTIVTAALLAFGGVYGIANRAPGDQGEQASTPPPYVGEGAPPAPE